MPIIDIQRRLREVGRIRLGEKAVSSKGKTYPTKLSTFRFTSADKQSIDMVAANYGGEVKIWDGASVGTQWELLTESSVLDVIVPPVDLAWSQYMELWSGGGCQRRCDRQTNIITDSPCVCDPDNPECKPTTRLGVILTAVDGIGVWRLESHGWGAATELNGAIEVLRVVQNRGSMVPARLLLEQRQSKRINQDTGKPETFNFAVPVLDLNLSVAALTGGAPAAVAQGATPIAAPVEDLPSIAEQVKANETPVERPRRANAAATLPPTNVPTPQRNPVDEVADVPTPTEPKSDHTPGGASLRSVRRLFALLNGNKSIGKDDSARHEWASAALGKPVASFNDLNQDDITLLNKAAEGQPVVAEPAASSTYGYGEEPF